ncbi:lysylphosphatidylglycerol synthase domain-containing protein [Lysobacter sp. GCM10012299]|uniref:lysylphosphatidylglycerol synthase domain-containing protein n=1 Tax=Lysobacter sp. GCM10012299 TaxID=3317333 RepID=UPI00362116CB
MGQDHAPQNRRRSLRAWLTFAGACLLAWLAWASRHELAGMVAACDPALLSMAVLMGIVFTIAQGSLLAWLLTKQGARHSRREAIAAFLVSQPGKYIPGKIWSPLMQSVALKDGATLGGVTIANVELAVISVVQVFALGLVCLQVNSPAIIATTVVVATAACVLIGLLPTTKVVNRISPGLASLLKLPPTVAHQASPLSATLICLAGMASNFAASFLVLKAAGTSIPADALLPVLAALYLGFAASILAIPVPAGIGIREFAAAGLGHILAPGIPTTMIVSAALLFRCWQIIVDLACLAVGLMLARLGRA